MNNNFSSLWTRLLLITTVAASSAAIARAPISEVGSGSLKDRVSQLERISNSQADLLTQLQQQIADQQRDIDSLRGQLQQSQYQLNQAQQKFAVQEGGEEQQVEQTAGSIPSGTEQHSSVPMSGDVNVDYNAAVSLALEKKQYDEAIAAFQAFVKRYPDSTYQPNANYWLGQLNYNKDKKDDAAYYFALVVKNHPKSPKSPDAMLKVGLIMQDKGQNDKAKAVYQQILKQYPGTEAAQQAEKRLASL